MTSRVPLTVSGPLATIHCDSQVQASMNQLTVRGFDPALARRIREVAKARGLSLNQTRMHTACNACFEGGSLRPPTSMKGRGVRVIKTDDLKGVTPDARPRRASLQQAPTGWDSATGTCATSPRTSTGVVRPSDGPQRE